MSVPVLLTLLDPNGATATPASAPAAASVVQQTPQLLLVDEHLKNCTAYMEAATIISPNYPTAVVNDIDVLDTAQETCTPIPWQFTVQLHMELQPNEFVGLTGDSKSLGEWQLDRCVTLKPKGNLQWSTNVMLQSCSGLSYRYFIYVEDKHGRKQIRRWETQLQPRTLQPDAEGSSTWQLDRFGEVDGSAAVETPQIKRGWLTSESIVQLKFEHEQMFEVLDINKFDPDHVLVKIVPLTDEQETASDTLEAGVHIEIAKLKYGESLLQPQQNYGISYRRGDVVIFHVTVPLDISTTFALVFHTPEQQQPIGKAIVHSSDLSGSEGVLELKITEPQKDAHTTIARLHLPYLIIKPFADAILDFRTTYAHYWPKSWPNLDVGHRGNGRSYSASHPPVERENTLASFLRAYECNADMIELDVHLTADGVPIIYHDFGLRTAPQGKQITSPSQLHYVLIKDLSYEALKQLRVFAVVNDMAIEYPAHNAEPRLEHRIFPRLVDVLESMPRTLGIDVEIKWPQRKAAGGVEARQTIDKNFFVDRVLATIVAHGCGRPLVFSSFDADICTMLRFKQNLFPVLYLTQGETKKWQPFLDLRTRTFEQAINNAQAFELAGTAPHAEDLLGDDGPLLMQKARDLGQIALVWGDDCNSKERVKYLSEIGATAICYDRMDLYAPSNKQRSFFNATDLIEEFEAQCRF